MQTNETFQECSAIYGVADRSLIGHRHNNSVINALIRRSPGRLGTSSVRAIDLLMRFEFSCQSNSPCITCMYVRKTSCATRHLSEKMAESSQDTSSV